MTMAPMDSSQLRWVEPMLRDCGEVFKDEEVETAVQMAHGAVLSGEYSILAAAEGKRLIGFCIAGQVPLTESTWCLYWLVVHPQFQRRGVGAALQSAIEREMRASGGHRIVCETSGRDCYAPARAFYRSAGYVEYGRVADYYSPGDSCLFLCKVI
jgi:ribosomal protein S18 acetylase RimI-like enzyme